MKKRGLLTPTLWMISAFSLGCTMDYEPSLVEGSKILAVRSEIAADSSEMVTIETLAVGIDAVTMTVCAAPWLPTEEGIECLTPSWDLPVAEGTLTAYLDMSQVILPPELLAFTDTLYIKVAAQTEDVVPAVCQISLTTPPDNPKLTGVLMNNMPPIDWVWNGEEEVNISTTWENEGDENDTSISFYTTSGFFSPWRTNDGAPSTWTPDPDISETIQLFVIARTLGVGSTWTTVEITP